MQMTQLLVSFRIPLSTPKICIFSQANLQISQPTKTQALIRLKVVIETDLPEISVLARFALIKLVRMF